MLPATRPSWTIVFFVTASFASTFPVFVEGIPVARGEKRHLRCLRLALVLVEVGEVGLGHIAQQDTREATSRGKVPRRVLNHAAAGQSGGLPGSSPGRALRDSEPVGRGLGPCARSSRLQGSGHT